MCWLHFYRLRGGCLSRFGLHCHFAAQAHVHKGPVLSAELLSHPLGTRHAASGREWLRAGCAPRRLVVLQPSVVMLLTNAPRVLRLHIPIDGTAPRHLQVLLLTQSPLQPAAAAVAADTPHLRTEYTPCESHHTRNSTRATHTRRENDFQACIVISKRCKRNGEFFPPSVHPQ